MEENKENTVFDTIKILEGEIVNAETKKQELSKQLQQIEVDREALVAKINFLAGVAASARESAEKILKAKNLTLADYAEWKGLTADVTPGETEH